MVFPGVPYVQENVLTRMRKTIDVMVGESSHKLFPTHIEPAKDKIVSTDIPTVWTSTNGALLSTV